MKIFAYWLMASLPFLVSSANVAPAPFSCLSDAPSASYCVDLTVMNGSILVRDRHSIVAGTRIAANWKDKTGSISMTGNGRMQYGEEMSAAPAPPAARDAALMRTRLARSSGQFLGAAG